MGHIFFLPEFSLAVVERDAIQGKHVSPLSADKSSAVGVISGISEATSLPIRIHFYSFSTVSLDLCTCCL